MAALLWGLRGKGEPRDSGAGCSVPGEEEDGEEGAQRRGQMDGHWLGMAAGDGRAGPRPSRRNIYPKKKGKKEECHHLLARSPILWATKMLRSPPKSTPFACGRRWPQGRAAERRWESPAN